MYKLLITGASGFVGKNLMKCLLNKENIQASPLNFRNPIQQEQLDNVDAIIHLAGKAHDLAKTASDQEYFEVNTTKTIALFDLFLKSDCKDFIYFSSVKAAADTVDDILIENVQPDPKTPYGQSKFEAEQYLLGQSLPPGKRVIILRPCMIHGPGNKGNLNLLYKVVEKGIPYPLGAFINRRSFLSIDNLLYILERLILEPKIPGGVYNVADDDALSTNELIKLIATGSKVKARIWELEPGLIKAAAKVGDFLHLPLNSERLKKLTESFVVSNDKIKKALTINKLPLSSREGLMATIQSFRSK